MVRYHCDKTNQLIQRLLSFCKTSRCNETITVNDKQDRDPSFLTTGATYRGNEKKKEMSKVQTRGALPTIPAKYDVSGCDVMY